MFHMQHPQKEAGTSAGKESLAISQSVAPKTGPVPASQKPSTRTKKQSIVGLVCHTLEGTIAKLKN